MPRSTIANIGRAGLKLAICGASLVAVAFCVVLLGGDSKIETSRADILAFDPVPESNTEKFENALDDLGHSEPRIYAFNGNEIGFSTRTTRRKPRRLVRNYQRAFVRRGLNQEMYRGIPGSRHFERHVEDVGTELQKRREAMMSGQIVPLEISDTYAVMAGALVAGKPQTRRGLEATLRERRPRALDELFRGYRTIEIFRNPESGSTSVTASWSRGRFDAKRHMPQQHPQTQGVDPDPAVPSCPGCIRQMRFAGRTRAKPDDLQVFRSPQKPRRVARFYDRAMENRGWERTRTGRVLGRLLERIEAANSERLFRQYEKNDRQITISIRRSSTFDATTVATYRRR